MSASSTGHSEFSEREFEILVGNYLATDDQLATELPHRSVGAIQVVRAFICAYHKGQNHSGLSAMMVKRLQAGAGLLTCPICRAAI